MPIKRPLTPPEIQQAVEAGYDMSNYRGEAIEFPDPTPQQAVLPQDASSTTGSFARGAAASALPTAAGGLGMAGGAKAGAALGTAILPGWGTGIGAIVGGLGGALGAAKLAAAGQEAVMPEEWKQQLALDVQQHPVASTAGGLAALPLGGFIPSPSNVGRALGTIPKLTQGAARADEIANLANVGGGAALGGVQEAVMAPLEGRELTLGNIALNTGIGALVNKPWALGGAYGFSDATPIAAADPDRLAATLRMKDKPVLPADYEQQVRDWQAQIAKKKEAESARRAEDFKKAQVELAMQEAGGLEALLKGKQLTQSEQRVTPRAVTETGKEIFPDYTGVTEADNAAVAAESAADLEARRMEGLKDRYQEGDTDVKPTNAYRQALDELLTQQNIRVTDKGELVNREGKPVKGQALLDQDYREVLINLGREGLDTRAHEGLHYFRADLEQLAQQGDTQAKRLLEQWDTMSAEGLAKANAARVAEGKQPWDSHEFTVSEQGKEFVRQQLISKERGVERWWNDVKSLFKSRYSKDATLADLRRAINLKFLARRGMGVVGKEGPLGATMGGRGSVGFEAREINQPDEPSAEFIGNVQGGQVNAKRVKDGMRALHHSEGLDGYARWRVSWNKNLGRHEVIWSDGGTHDNKIAVENYLAKQGIYEPKHIGLDEWANRFQEDSPQQPSPDKAEDDNTSIKAWIPKGKDGYIPTIEAIKMATELKGKDELRALANKLKEISIKWGLPIREEELIERAARDIVGEHEKQLKINQPSPDKQEYERLTTLLKNTSPDKPEFAAIWKQLEDVKNRHGGMKPRSQEDAAIKFRESGKQLKDIIDNQWDEGHPDEGGDGYWIQLKDGWTLDDATVVHEATKNEALQRAKSAVYTKPKTRNQEDDNVRITREAKEETDDLYRRTPTHTPKEQPVSKEKAAEWFDEMRRVTERNQEDDTPLNEDWRVSEVKPIKSSLASEETPEEVRLNDEMLRQRPERNQEEGTEDIELGIDKGQILHLLGASNYAGDLAPTAVKELFQNSFDALKEAMWKGEVKNGDIDIKVNQENRTITIKDNGVGMTPETVKKAFFTVGGTKKDLPPELRSGGLGLAKIQFMIASEKIKVSTVKDGYKTEVEAHSKDIAEGKFPIKTTKTDEPNGTSVEVTIPKERINRRGEKQAISLPSYVEAYGALTKPFIPPKGLTVKFNDKPIDFASRVPPHFTKVKYKWGEADIYVSEEPKRYPTHSILSSGIFQFNKEIQKKPIGWDRLPFDVVIDIKPKVTTADSFYPFNNQREDFRPSVNKDIAATIAYLQKMGRAHDEGNARKAFETIKPLPKIDAEAGLTEEQKAELVRLSDRTTGPIAKYTPPEYISVTDEGVYNPQGVLELIKKKNEYGQDKWGDASMEAEKDIELGKAVDMGSFDDKQPQFHNNTDADYMEFPKAPEFFAKMASIMHDAAQWVKNIYPDAFEDAKYFSGVSIDKEYAGVHTNYPFKGIFINPAAVPSDITNSAGLAGYYAHVVLHELTHTRVKSEGADFTSEFSRLYALAEDDGFADRLRYLFKNVVNKHTLTLEQIRNKYESSRTSNITKSLKQQSDEGAGLSTRAFRSDESIKQTGKPSTLQPKDSGQSSATSEKPDKLYNEYRETSREHDPDVGRYQEDDPNLTVPPSDLQPDTSRKGFLRAMEGAFDKVGRLDKRARQAFIRSGKRVRKFMGMKDSALEDLGKYNKTIRNSVLAAHREAYRNDTTPEFTTPEEHRVSEILSNYFGKIAEERAAAGMKIDGRVAKAGGERNKYYVPDQLNDAALDILTNKPNSPEAKSLMREWAKYVSDESGGKIKFDEALKNIEEYKTGLKGGDTHYRTLNFGAIRKAAGYGLPENLRETDTIHVVDKYGRRAANDMALFMELESKPDIASMLGLRDPDTGQIPKTAEYIGDNNEVINAMKWVTGSYANRTQQQPRINALSRLIHNTIMGAPTGVRDTATIPLNTVPYINRWDDVMAFFRGTMNTRSLAREALETGARIPNVDKLQFNELKNAPDRTTAFLSWAASQARKWSGREWIENWNRNWVYAVGKELALTNIIGARNGNKKSQMFIEKFNDLIDGDITTLEGKAFDDAVKQMAKNFVDRNQGTYSGEGLPTGVVDSQFAPFLALNKWGIEKSNVIYKDVIQPFITGENRLPLLTYSLGTILTGAAIQQLNELMSGKKAGDPTIKEALDKGDPKAMVSELITLMQLASFAGIMSDITKAVSDRALHGKSARNVVSYPTATALMDTTEKTTDMIEALNQGEDPWEVFKMYALDLLTTNVQTLRSIANYTVREEDVERTDKFRDRRVYAQLQGERASDIPTTNRYLGIDERKFKRSDNLQEAVAMLPSLVQDAILDAEGNPFKLQRALRGLKGNSYQTMPSPDEDPKSFIDYRDFLRRTQGEEEAGRRTEDFLRQRMINRMKSSLVPSF